MKGRELIWRMNAEEALTPQHGAMLIRLEAARAVGGFNRSVSGIYEDSVFFTKLLGANTVYISDDCVTVYRMHWNHFAIAPCSAATIRTHRSSLFDMNTMYGC